MTRDPQSAVRPSESTRQRVTRRATVVLLALGALATLLPIYYMLVVGSRRTDGTLSLLWFDGFALFSNMAEVMGDPRFPRYLINSFVMSASIAVGECALAGAAGYALAKLRFPGRRPLFAIVIATLALSPVVTTVPVYIMVKNLGWTSSYPGLIVPLLLSGFGVFLVRQFALGIPDAIINAARVDGASEVRIFFQIALPLLRPALLTLFLVVFVAQWDNLLWPLVVSSHPDTWTLPVGLSSFQGEYGVTYRLVMAGSIIAVIPPMVLFALLQRYYVRGLTLGSLKG